MENNPSSRPWYADGGSIDAASAGGNTEKPLMEQAKEQTQQVLQQTQQKAGQVIDQARTQVMSQLDSQKERATGGLESVALALRQTGQNLREQDQTALSEYTEGIAGTVERFSGYLSRRDAREMLGEVESFARRQPTLFLGSALALGFMAARFLKSSSPTHGAMAGQGSALPNTGGTYRSGTGDLANPVDVTGVTGSGSTGLGMPTPGLSATAPRPPAGTTTGAARGTSVSSHSAAGISSAPPVVDADEDADLVVPAASEKSGSEA